MKPRYIALTFDVEQDSNLSSFEGIKRGLPQILRILNQNKITATFFITGEVAEAFPRIVRNLSKNHGIACHGYYHESFQKMNSEKMRLIQAAKKVIEDIIGKEIMGFRAPYLRICPELFITLKRVGFKYDSSLTWSKMSHWFITPPIREFRILLPNVLFRFPLLKTLFKLGIYFNSVTVLYFHPWEALDMRSLFQQQPRYSKTIFWRPDRWFNCGSQFLRHLATFLSNYLRQGYHFIPLENYL
ncbi:MAG: polysaccharide deacetylase family protein [Candidatus Helarchaeota archaeon]